MKTNTRNVRIVVENNGTSAGFNIYLDFSGQREFLMLHRHNGLLYQLLEDGMRLDDLRRWEPRRYSKQARRHLEGRVSHLLQATDEYIAMRGVEYLPTSAPTPTVKYGTVDEWVHINAA